MPNFRSQLRDLFCLKGVNKAAVGAGPGKPVDLFGGSMRPTGYIGLTSFLSNSINYQKAALLWTLKRQYFCPSYTVKSCWILSVTLLLSLFGCICSHVVG